MSGRLRLALDRREPVTVLTAQGDLDPGTYPYLRDGLFNAATDAPEGLVADISGLVVHDDALVRVFTLAAMRIDDWPGVPFGLVTDRPEHRALLRHHTIDRQVPVGAEAGAVFAGRERPPRRRADRTFTRMTCASAEARSFTGEVLTGWGRPELVPDAQLVVTELVDNVLGHTRSIPRLRLELRRGRGTVAVSDRSSALPVVREGPDARGRGLGMRLVANIARVWGCSRYWNGGKVVWATLPAVPAQAGTAPARRDQAR